MSRIARVTVSVIPLMAALTLASPAFAQVPSASPGAEAAPVDCTVPSLTALPSPADGAPPDLAGGAWEPMAKAPFGSEYEPVAWTGTRMVVVDSDTGRTATYRPDTDAWRVRSTSPRPFDRAARTAWTGAELVIAELSADGTHLRGLAYRPQGDHWREIAPLEITPDGQPDHALADAIWTGTHVVVVDALGALAAYDPVADCWSELGSVPADPTAWRLYLADGRLLVESRRWDEPVELRAFDPATGEWSEPAVGPLAREASERGAVEAGGSLVYITWDGSLEPGTANARFDPVTMAWAEFEHDCATRASGTVAAGTLLVAASGARALDSETLACVVLPDPPRALDGSERLVWTGADLIAWSGIREERMIPRTGGYVLRAAVDDP